MFKQIIAFTAVLVLSGCSYLHVHKQDITQGNVINQSAVSRLHNGMSQETVKEVMGPPMLANIFTPGRIEYVYTIQPGGKDMRETRVTCLFEHDRLVRIEQSDVY